MFSLNLNHLSLFPSHVTPLSLPPGPLTYHPFHMELREVALLYNTSLPFFPPLWTSLCSLLGKQARKMI